MKLKWSKADLAYFTKPIPKVTVDYDWVWWALMVAISLSGIIYLIGWF